MRRWNRTKLWSITGRLSNKKVNKLNKHQQTFMKTAVNKNTHWRQLNCHPLTCECTPEVLRDPFGVAEFGGDPIESLRGGLDFEYVRSDIDAVCLSTQGDGDVTLLFSECCRTFGLWPGNWTVSSHAVFSWAWLVDNFMTSPLTAGSIKEINKHFILKTIFGRIVFSVKWKLF